MNNELFIRAVVQVGIDLNKTIEAIEDRLASFGTISDDEILEELSSIRNQLADQISIALETDGKKLLRDLAVAKLEADRALLRAAGVPL